MATITYQCSICQRQIELLENQTGLTTFSKCIITNGCKGKLNRIKRNIDSSRGSFPPEVQGLTDYVQRRAFFEYNKQLPSTIWSITHNMGISPAVDVYVYDANNNNLVTLSPDDYVVKFVNKDSITINFTSSYSGIAQLIARNSVKVQPKTLSSTIPSVQVTSDGTFIFAIPKYLTKFYYPPSISPTPTIPYDLNNQIIRIEILVKEPNNDPVSCTETLEANLFDTPWNDWNEILVRKRKNCYLFTKNINDFRTFINQNSNTVNIPTGTQLQITRIDYGTGVFEPIDPEGLFVLLTNSPYASADKVLNKVVDAANIIDNVNPYFVYNGTEFAVDQSCIEKVYPSILNIKTAILNPSPTPTPSMSGAGSSNCYDLVILNDTPSHYYPLNQSSPLSDSIGNNDIVNASDIGFNSDQYGNTLDFDATYSVMLDSPIMLTTNYSIEFWINYNDPTIEINQTFENYLADSRSDHLGIFNEIGFILFAQTLNNIVEWDTSAWFTSSTDWYHIVITVDDNYVPSLYINGQFQSISSSGASTLTSDGFSFQYIGGLSSDSVLNSYVYYSGLMGNIAVYNNVLSSDEVQNHYSVGVSGCYRYSSFIIPTPSPSVSMSLTPTVTPTITITPSATPYVYKLLERLNDDGTIDYSMPHLNFVDSSLDYWVSYVGIINNKIYISGEFTSIDSNTYNRFARLNMDGTLDTDYSSLSITTSWESVADMTATDSYIFGVGAFTDSITNYAGCVRMMLDGSIDTTYTNLNITDVCKRILNFNDKLYVCGYFTNYNGYRGILRLNLDGTLDTTFVNPFTALPINTATINDMTIGSDGNLYMTGGLESNDGTSYFGVCRLNSDGTFDTDYFNQINANHNDSGGGAFYFIRQSQEGHIYIGGVFDGSQIGTGTSGDLLIRLDSNGVLDSSYVSPFTQINLEHLCNFIQIPNGDIYMSMYGANTYQSQLFKFDSSGTFVGPMPISVPAGGYTNMAYDTINNKIYIGGYVS